MHDRGKPNNTSNIFQAAAIQRKMRARLCLLAVCATVSFALIGQLGVTVSRSLPSAVLPQVPLSGSGIACEVGAATMHAQRR